MAAVNQRGGDPTFSVLKTHLVFEELLRAYLDHQLHHPSALKGARLSFAQLLAVAGACSECPPDVWIWEAIRKLNSLRNKLAHNLSVVERDDLIRDFISFVVSNSKVPMPPPTRTNAAPTAAGEQFFSEFDMAAAGLFGATVGQLGLEMDFG
jgi:hypothetical protein